MLKKLFIALITLTILLTACGGPDSPAVETEDGGFRIITATPGATAIPTLTPTPIVPELDPAALDGLAVDFWYFWEPGLEDALADAVTWFNVDNPDGAVVSARRFTHPADLQAAVTESIAIGQPPDVILAEPYQYLPWEEAGAVVDLAPYLAHPSYGLALDELYPAVAARDEVAGVRLAFPGLLTARVLLYNLSWAETLGFSSPPASADSFLRQACAAHQANGDRTGGWMISHAAAPAWLLAYQETPGEMLDFKSGAVEDAYQFLLDLNGQGCAWQPTEPYPDQAFADRLGLFYSVTTREIGYVEEAFKASGSRDEWTAIGYPNSRGETTVSFYGPSYVVLKSELESQVAAWLFVKYMTGEKIQTHLAETALYLPLDRTTSDTLSGDPALPAAWRDSLTLLDSLVIEPRHPQWVLVRAALGEAQTELLDERFAAGTLSLFLDRFDKLSEDLVQLAVTPEP